MFRWINIFPLRKYDNRIPRLISILKFPCTGKDARLDGPLTSARERKKITLTFDAEGRRFGRGLGLQ